MSRDTDPDLNDVFAVAFEREQVSLRTIVPGHITAFSRNPRECTVKIDMLAQLRTGETVELPEIFRCPIVWPVGGGFAMDADLAIGEQVMVLVCDRDISGWLPAGAVEAPKRRLLHNLSNAIVLPGLRSINRQGKQAPAAGELYLGNDTGAAPWLKLGTIPPSATLEAPAISLGEGATLGVARLTDPVSCAELPLPSPPGVPDLSDPWVIWFNAVGVGAASVPGPPPWGSPIAFVSSASTTVRSK